MDTTEIMKEIGDGVKQHLPEGFGYAVLVFPHNKSGIANYVSDSNREDMIKALRETADRLEEKGLPKRPPNRPPNH